MRSRLCSYRRIVTSTPATSAPVPSGPGPSRAVAPAAARTGRMVGRPGFVVTVFLGSFLLFQVQPMVSADAIDGVRAAGGTWRDLSDDSAPRTWTDDYASVLPLLK